MHLADARHRECRCVHALAQRSLALGRLDVDDDVALGKRALHGLFDRVRRRVPLAHRRVGRDADDDVGEVTTARLAHAEPPELNRGPQPGDRGTRRSLGVDRHAVHQDIDVAPHQSRCGDEDEDRDEERRERIALAPPCPGEDQPDEHRRRAGEVAAEVHRVGRERRASELARRPKRDRHAAQVDGDHDRDDEKGVPDRIDGWLRRADEHVERAVRDVEADEHEQRGLSEGSEVLGLAVPVGMRAVGGATGDADGEERQQRGDEVGPGMNRLGDQAQAAGREAGPELERDQHAGGNDRNEGSAPLRAHPGRLSGEVSLGRASAAVSPGVSGLVPAAASEAAEEQAEQNQDQSEPETVDDDDDDSDDDENCAYTHVDPLSLEISAERLLALDRLEQCLEIAFSKPP